MGLIGNQYPRLCHYPKVASEDLGEAAVQFSDWAGMTLFPWQKDVLRRMCSQNDDGRWAANESVIIVPRQNGKGEILVARELAGIYLFGEKSILHTAHFLDTAIDARDRLWDFIENNDDLYYWWEDDPDTPGTPQLINTNGKESIQFPNGAKIRFRTRTEKTGRGLSFSTLVFDECFHLPNQIHSAISKTTRAQENPHTIYISTPVNRLEHAHGTVFSAKRWAAIDKPPRTLYMEWSVDPDEVDIFSREALMQANPSLTTSGFGAQLDDTERDMLAAKTSEVLREEYLVETLGVGNWVPRDGEDTDFIPIVDIEAWKAMQTAKPAITPEKEAAIGIDVNINSDVCAMVAAIKTTRGVHLSIAERVTFSRDELLADLDQAVEKNDPLAVAFDIRSPASTIERGVEKLGIEPTIMKARDITRAYMIFQQLVAENRLTHDGDPRWVEALNTVTEREIGEFGKGLKRVSGAGAPMLAAIYAIFALDENVLEDVVPAKPRKRFMPKGVSLPTPAAAGVGAGRAWQQDF